MLSGGLSSINNPSIDIKNRCRAEGGELSGGEVYERSKELDSLPLPRENTGSGFQTLLQLKKG